MPFRLVSFPFDQTTPDILDPAGQGTLIATLAAGEYVDCSVLISQNPDQPVEFDTVLSPDGNAFSCYLSILGPGDSALGDGQGMPEAVMNNSGGTPIYAGNQRSAKATDANAVYFALYSRATPPTTFAGEVVLKIYS